MLKSIIRHTYSDGDDQSNPDLSNRRAELVKTMLTKEVGVGAATMQTDGTGEGELIIKTHQWKTKQKIE